MTGAGPANTGWTVVWEVEALNSAQRFLADDPGGVRAVFDRVDHLAEDPRPPEASPWGGDHWRLRIGRYRVLYNVTGATVTVSVVHLGRGPARPAK